MVEENTIPLCVDLDGTLILSDMLHESTIAFAKVSPLSLLSIPKWLLKGKALLKQELVKRIDFDPALLPYNQSFLEWLKEQNANGRKLILCTASDHTVAEQIANHLQIFDAVMASDGNVNLAAGKKAQALVELFGEKGFDYAGNSSADIKVWEHARRAIVVNASDSVQKDAQSCAKVECYFGGETKGLGIWRKAFRVHQWLKNILLFVPLLAAHQYYNFGSILTLILAFLAFSLCASSVYIANDLLDLESDRSHPRKSKRPFASGALPVWKGVIAAPILLFISLSLAYFVQGSFLMWLLIYFSITCFYSFLLKRLVLVDCITLAVLYTLRVVAGAAAVDLSLSFWLLAFCIFLFLSLAFIKRYAELQVQLLHGKEKAHGRGYYTADAQLVQMLGVAAAYSSALVLALYLNSEAVVKLYSNPHWIWGCVPIILFWNSWLWLQAHRGEMHDDPLVFAVKDKTSLVSGVAFAIFLAIGTLA